LAATPPNRATLQSWNERHRGAVPDAFLVAGAAGTAVFFHADRHGIKHPSLWASIVFLFASAASWGCGNVVTRAARPKRPFSLLVWSSLAAPAPLLVLSLIFEGTGRWQSAASSVGASGITALAYVIVVSTFFGYGTWYWLMARYQASTVAPFTLLVPIVGILTAWLVRSEHPSFGELFGSFVVLVGLGLALGVLDAVAARGSASTSVGA
jgi:O-acetylserine/cysteine efflux transporter